MIEIKPVELTAESFNDYGYIISSGIGEPMAKNGELTYWGKVCELKFGEVVSTGILYGHEREPVIQSLERHVNTPEMLAALEGDSVICFGKPSSGCCEEITGIQAFYIKQGDALIMHPGTWHWVAVPVNCKQCKFLVLFASGTEANDLEVKSLPESIIVSL